MSYRDAILVAIINSLTSILAGFVVFSVLGFMSKQLDKDINHVASKGSFYKQNVP